MSAVRRNVVLFRKGVEVESRRHSSHLGIIQGMMRVRDKLLQSSHRVDAPTVHPMPYGTHLVLQTRKLLERGAKNRSFGKDDFRRGRKPKGSDPFTGTIDPNSAFSKGQSYVLDLDLRNRRNELKAICKDKSYSKAERHSARIELYKLNRRIASER